MNGSEDDDVGERRRGSYLFLDQVISGWEGITACASQPAPLIALIGCPDDWNQGWTGGSSVFEATPGRKEAPAPQHSSSPSRLRLAMAWGLASSGRRLSVPCRAGKTATAAAAVPSWASAVRCKWTK